MLLRTVAVLALASCAGGLQETDGDPSDFAPVDWSGGKADASGVPAAFDRNNIMTDDVMVTMAVDASGVQDFLENSPYGRTWLADVTIDGAPFSERLVDIASQYGIDPIVLLARMQVESSLVSAKTQPSNWRINSALGCACPDYGTCGDAGLVNQLDCAGQLLAKLENESIDGTGAWDAGTTRSTSDHYRVTPTNDATAALYAYTPWVLPGSGGNWLVWNITRRYLKWFDAAGTLNLPSTGN